MRVLLCCVIAILFAFAVGCSPVRPVPSVPLTSLASATPIARPADSPIGPGWTLVVLGDASTSVQFRSILAVADGFVAVGSRGWAGEVPVALHSADGASWTDEVITGRFGGPSRLIAWGDRVLGIGAGETGRECAHPSAMDTWVRSAGATWTEAPFDRNFCDNGGDVVDLDGRLWLAGAVRDVPSLMDSADGLTWTNRSDRLGGLFPQAAAVDGSGLWVFARDLAGGSVALHNRDGLMFERRPIQATSGEPVDVVGPAILGGDLLVIVASGGVVGTLRPDGASGWREAQSVGFPPGKGAAIDAVDGHLIALGSDDNGLPIALASGDGSTWSPIRLPVEAGPGTTLFGVAVANDTAVLVGQVELPDGSAAVGAIWTAPAAILAP